jgi:hypothetical protein
MGENPPYIENYEIAPQSLIREDDCEVFLRATTYRNKLTKVVNKLCSRLKWLGLNEKYLIYEAAIAG